MTIVVLGAGAIGSLYAAKLASAKHSITVLARGAHADAINRHGLRMTGLEECTCRLAAVTSLDDLPESRFFLLTTKVNDNASVSTALANRLRPGSVVLCVQNGLGAKTSSSAPSAIAPRCCAP